MLEGNDYTETETSTDCAPVLKSPWLKPSLAEEFDELQDAADDLGVERSKLVESFHKAELEELSDENWLNLENADSRDVTWTIDQVREHLKVKRDFARIEAGFRKGETMPSPIVLFREGRKPYLIAGNSRLMGCRAMGLRPTVLALHV